MRTLWLGWMPSFSGCGFRLRHLSLAIPGGFRRLVCVAGMALRMLTGSGPLSAAPPANDNVENAHLLLLNQAAFGSNVSATPQSSVDTLLEGTGSVWWKWTAPADQDVAAETKRSNFDTILTILEKNAMGAWQRVLANDEGWTIWPQSRVYFRAKAGTHYWLAVTGYKGEAGAVRLRVFPATPPPVGAAFGDMEKKEAAEETRWHLNRARFSPRDENAERETSYAVPAGPLSPVTPHLALTLAAERHSEDMARLNYFDHTTIAGSLFYTAGNGPSQRAAREGYSAGVAENISWGYAPGEEAHWGWWDSSGHRANMLNAAHRECGHGVFALLGEAPLTTQIFGSRSNAPRFFTDTAFEDMNASGSFHSNEGIEGVVVELMTGGTVVHSAASDVAGGFAVPMNGLSATATVMVQLYNPDSETLTLHLPTGYRGTRRIVLAPGMRRPVASFTPGAAAVNLGWRQITHLPAPTLAGPLRITRDPTSGGITFAVAIQGVGAATLETSPDLSIWRDVETKMAASADARFTREASAASTAFFRVRVE